MSDAGDEDKGRDGSTGAGGRAPLTLKPRGGAVNAGVVRQSFSHGRSKTVVVETKRRRPRRLKSPSPRRRKRRPSPPSPKRLQSRRPSPRTGCPNRLSPRRALRPPVKDLATASRPALPVKALATGPRVRPRPAQPPAL